MVKYEKLSNFCFSSGKLGHVAKGCVEKARCVMYNQNEMRYRAYMKAMLIRNIVKDNVGG